MRVYQPGGHLSEERGAVGGLLQDLAAAEAAQVLGHARGAVEHADGGVVGDESKRTVGMGGRHGVAIRVEADEGLAVGDDRHDLVGRRERVGESQQPESLVGEDVSDRARGEHRMRARVGDLSSAKLLVGAGANVNDADAWGVSATVLAAHSGYTELVEFLLDRGADANAAGAGFAALHAAIMHRDEKMVAALLAHGADPNAPLRTWTPTRRSSKDFNFAPELVGATPFWLAARFTEPEVMRLLAKHGADPLVVHRAEYADESQTRRTQVTTALMAATGMGGGVAWVRPDLRTFEAQMLEAVKLAVDLGVDLNAANADGRTALDAATAFHYETVVKFLVEKGARPGVKKN